MKATAYMICSLNILAQHFPAPATAVNQNHKQESAMQTHRFFFPTMLFICAILAGCTQNLQITEMDTGHSLKATLDPTHKTISVIMPDSDVLEGKYRPANQNPYPTGKDGSPPEKPPKTGFGSGVPSGIPAEDYALLQSRKTKLMMEVFLHFDTFSGKGYGYARTNDGKRFKISY